MRQINKLCVILIVAGVMFNGCKKDAPTEPQAHVVKYGEPFIYQGETYQTLIIGDQMWTASDLRTDKHDDGTTIKQFEWSNLDKRYDTAYMVDASGNYNYYYLPGFNPTKHNGWRIAQYEDWGKLFKYIRSNVTFTTTSGITAQQLAINNWEGLKKCGFLNEKNYKRNSYWYLTYSRSGEKSFTEQFDCLWRCSESGGERLGLIYDYYTKSGEVWYGHFRRINSPPHEFKRIRLVKDIK